MTNQSDPMFDGAREAPTLCPADAAALEALVEAGFEWTEVPDEHRVRAERIADVLGLIDTPIPRIDRDADVLLDTVLARIDRSASDEPLLSYRDESALEAWVMAGYRSDRVPASLRERAARLDAMRSAVVADRGSESGIDADELVSRTLDRVQAQIDAQADRMSIDRERVRRGIGVRLADLASVAAVLLIGSAIIWPMVASMRYQSHLQACASNMQTAGMGFGLYAGDHRAALPVTTAGRPGRPWWNTGTPEESNSANLYRLVADGYAELDDLACPGNPAAVTDLAPDARDWPSHEELSYSYRVMVGSARDHQARWGQQERSVVISDLSPIVSFSMRGEPFVPETNSLQHNGRGQQALLSDGSAVWMETPVFDGDNIWLPANVENAIRIMRAGGKAAPLRGTETPATSADDFVGP